MSKQTGEDRLGAMLSTMDDAWGEALEQVSPDLQLDEVGHVLNVQTGVARIQGLPGVQSEELVEFPGRRLGMAFDLGEQAVGVILLDDPKGIESGDTVRRTGRVMDIPVGESMLGRVIDAVGRPLDEGGSIRAAERRPVERPAPGVLDRSPVSTPLQTGIKVVDAMIPVGRGQRELIVGDRQTGKTSIALDAILNQRDSNVACIYCAIGQRASAVASVLADLRKADAMDYTTVIVASGDDPPGIRWAAPYAAMSLGEYFMDQGSDVLVVMDDLTQHARSYRELSLLLRRPPGREAYPGDIFYVHSRLLERATHLREEHGGGSLTALPIIETQAQNISAYIPTNLISITDGQIYLSPDLFRRGQLPAIDVGRSVSRVGGKAQLPAFREATGDLRLAYSQFEELERFSRYGTRLEEKQQKQLEHGRRVRSVLRQDERDTRRPAAQVAILYVVSQGLLDEIPADRVADVEDKLRDQINDELRDLAEKIESGEKLDDEDKQTLRDRTEEILREMTDPEDGRQEERNEEEPQEADQSDHGTPDTDQKEEDADG